MESADLQLGRAWQIAAYVALTLVALVFTVILHPASEAHFGRFFGEANAIVVIFAASVLGAAALWWLASGYEFVVFSGKETLRGLALSAAFATVLGVATMVADVIFRYPQDLNVPVPEALLFYPAIGFFAEIAFHVVPLALLLLILKPLDGWLGGGWIVWLGILLVALIEPTFQVAFAGEGLTGRAVYTGLNVFAIASLQLWVFRRFDFVSMFGFRMFYYAYWHILWGVIRLEVLF